MEKKKSIQKLPDSELDVMLILWSYDRPVKIIDIYNDLQNIRPCTKSAIHAFVEHLHQKGFLKIEMSPDRLSYKLLTPLISEDEYFEAEAHSIASRLGHGRFKKLLVSLVEADGLTDSDLEEIAALLEKKK